MSALETFVRDNQEPLRRLRSLLDDADYGQRSRDARRRFWKTAGAVVGTLGAVVVIVVSIAQLLAMYTGHR